MTKRTIIEMAQEAGLKPDGDDYGAVAYRKAIEAFATLVVANLDPKSFMSWHEAKKVDCALAEFSPDISTEIKQLCREARRNK